jgi:hypothetical protein
MQVAAEGAAHRPHRAGGLLWQRNFRLVTLTGYALSGTLLLTRDPRAHQDLPVR